LAGLFPAIHAAAVGHRKNLEKTLDRQILQIATRKTPIISTPAQSADQAFPKLFLAGSSNINSLEAKKVGLLVSSIRNRPSSVSRPNQQPNSYTIIVFFFRSGEKISP
jgi:hypothetical protein